MIGKDIKNTVDRVMKASAGNKKSSTERRDANEVNKNRKYGLTGQSFATVMDNEASEIALEEFLEIDEEFGEKLLDVKDLTVSFKTDNGIVRAVRGVSFDLKAGETLCIVGESGSGKSVTSKTIMGILASNAIIDAGSIMYRGENLLEISEEEFHKIRGNRIGMIFQDPLSSLNPIVRIGKQITEAMLINSNKLKQKYEHLIEKELIAYKNCIAKRDIYIKREENIYQEAAANVNKKLSKDSTPEEKLAIKNELAQLKAARDQKIADIKADANSKLPALKEALNKKKNEAKQNVKEYKASCKEEHSKIMNALNEKLSTVKPVILPKFNEKKLKNKEKLSNEALKIKEAKAKYKEVLAIFKEKRNVYYNEKTITSLIELEKEYDAVMSNCNNKYDELKKQLEAEAAEIRKPLTDIENEINAENERYISQLKLTRKEAKKRALEIMKEVGIPLPEKRFKQYPFEFSGGMRQRIVIAIALTAAPEILICDEPTTALDVTIQAQILELIKKIQKERNIACIFITHDLGVVANMADRVAVMYAGKIVEYGKSDEIFFDPKHPYTWALLSSIPDVDSKERLEAIPGTPPNMIYPPKGDAFALRSKYAMKIDFEKEPPYFKVSDTHYAATWLLHEKAPKVEMPKIVSERIRIALEAKEKEDSSNE